MRALGVLGVRTRPLLTLLTFSPCLFQSLRAECAQLLFSFRKGTLSANLFSSSSLTIVVFFLYSLWFVTYMNGCNAVVCKCVLFYKVISV